MARKTSRRRSTAVESTGIRELRSVISELRRAVDQCSHDLEVQFKRIAQMQAELDEVRHAWTKSSSKQRRKRTAA